MQIRAMEEHGVPIRMISYGGSSHNVSILVDAQDKVAALRCLSAGLFK